MKALHAAEYVSGILSKIGISKSIIEDAKRNFLIRRKKRIFVLTGAGASIPYNIPDMSGYHKDFKLIDDVKIHEKPFGVSYEGYSDFVGATDLETTLTSAFFILKSLEGFKEGGGDLIKFRNMYIGFLERIPYLIDKEIRSKMKVNKITYNKTYSVFENYSKKCSISFFTTNYDMVAEKIREKNIGNLFKNLNFITPSNILNCGKLDSSYTKIHGSINELEDKYGILVPVISKSVLNARKEFLALYASMAFSALTSKMIVVIGNSLRDDDLREILFFIAKINQAKFVILDPAEVHDPHKDLKHLNSYHIREKFDEVGIEKLNDFLYTYTNSKTKTGYRMISDPPKISGWRFPENRVKRDFEIISNYRSKSGNWEVFRNPKPASINGKNTIFNIPRHHAVYPCLYGCIVLRGAPLFWPSESNKLIREYAEEQINLAKKYIGISNDRTEDN